MLLVNNVCEDKVDCHTHYLSIWEAFLLSFQSFSILYHKLCGLVQALISAWLLQSLKHFHNESSIQVKVFSPFLQFNHHIDTNLTSKVT
jgi:hypothetical protein